MSWLAPVGAWIPPRASVGLLVAAAASLAALLLLSPRVRAGELPPIGLVGAAVALMLAASSAIVWAAATGLAVAALTLAWLAAVPGRVTMAAARTGGLGAAALIAAVPLLSGTSGSSATAGVAAVLLAVGLASLLGVPPVGGWAVEALRTVPGNRLSPWLLLVAPALLLCGWALLPSLQPSTATTLGRLLLVAGLAGAVWGGLNSLLTATQARYGRILLADLALATASLGALPGGGRLAVLLLPLLHLFTAPLLLQRAGPGLLRQRRLAWFAVSSMPPAPGFWGRLLAIQACSAAGPVALAAAVVALVLIGSAGLLVLLRGEPSDLRLAESAARGSWAWLVALPPLLLGLAPQAAVALVFGGGT